MKSLFTKTAALVCAVLMAGSLTACGNKTETKETSEASATTSAVQQAVTAAAGTTPEQQTTVAGTTPEQQTTVAGTAEAQRSDSAAENPKADATDTGLVGSWEYESGGFTYTFNEDGSGVYDMAGTKMKFTYTAENSILSITYEGSTEPMQLEYILSGDTLNVKDSGGNDTIYHRK